MRNLIGFDTPSKKKAMEGYKNNSEENQELDMQEIQMFVDSANEKTRLETYERLTNLGNVICSDDFQKYSQNHRQQILMDFAYYSKVFDMLS